MLGLFTLTGHRVPSFEDETEMLSIYGKAMFRTLRDANRWCSAARRLMRVAGHCRLREIIAYTVPNPLGNRLQAP